MGIGQASAGGVISAWAETVRLECSCGVERGYHGLNRRRTIRSPPIADARQGGDPRSGQAATRCASVQAGRLRFALKVSLMTSPLAGDDSNWVELLGVCAIIYFRNSKSRPEFGRQVLRPLRWLQLFWTAENADLLCR
jgi:hypothetical protein